VEGFHEAGLDIESVAERIEDMEGLLRLMERETEDDDEREIFRGQKSSFRGASWKNTCHGLQLGGEIHSYLDKKQGRIVYGKLRILW